MNEDLFNLARNAKQEPLAYRMRPRTLDEYIGQDHIIGKGRLLRRAIQADLLSSLIFYGPPGTGKTTLARVIANTTRRRFVTLNAVLDGVKELRTQIDDAQAAQKHFDQQTILFVDEVHRWNKSQQDALLPWVENGTVILIGATTENPFFEVNAALVSRSRIFQLKPLTDDELFLVAKQAMSDKERGYGNYDIVFEKGALEHLVTVSAGDARSLLNALQLAVETTFDHFPPRFGEKITITMEVAEESIQKKVVLYDKEGDYHFDVISAFIKSLRGSDPDAALYWLARMVAAGEDPRFIFRRMLISAAEDIGLADPNAVAVVGADAQAFDRIGLPEGRFHLAHSALYLATCPKSNSALAFFDALSDVERENKAEVPNHLKDANRDAEGFGHGEGYLYPHAYKDHWVAQQYLPTSLQGKIYYKPGELGYEAKIREKVENNRLAQLEAASDDNFIDNLTFAPKGKEAKWLERATSQGSRLLLELKEKLFTNLPITRSDNILVLNATRGLILWEAMKHNPEGLTAAQVKTEAQLDCINHYRDELEPLLRPEVVKAQTADYLSSLDPELKFEIIIGKNFYEEYRENKNLLSMVHNRLRAAGLFVSTESLPLSSSRLSSFIADSQLRNELEAAETILSANSARNWTLETIEKEWKKQFSFVESEKVMAGEERHLDEGTLHQWFKTLYEPALNKLKLNDESTERKIMKALKNRTVLWNHEVAIIKAGLSPFAEKNKEENELEEIHNLVKAAQKKTQKN
jgi:ATPase related to the helicase subunit of the Holliday junction resolvase